MGGQAGEAGQTVGTALVAACCGDELGAEPGAHTGQTADHFGMRMLAKPGFDEGVEFRGLLLEVS